MSNTLQIRRGANADLPTLNAGELGFSTDTHQVYVGSGAANYELWKVGDVLRSIITLTAGENLVTGNVCYLKSDGKMWKASRSASATIAGFLVLCTETISADATGKFLIVGTYNTSGLTAGNTLFIDTTAGAVTGTKPSTTGNLVRVVGYALSTTKLYFNPDGLYFEVG